MGWEKCFNIEENTPKNMYESSLFEEFLMSKQIKESSRTAYRGHKDELVSWINEHGLRSIDAENAKKYILDVRERKSAKATWRRRQLFSEYCDYLIKRGNLSVNPWKQINRDEVRCGLEDVRRENALKIRTKANLENGTPLYTLSDVAELLLAIEDENFGDFIRIVKGV